MAQEALVNDDDLAAEYVLGVLEADVRADVARRIDQDLEFARLVAAWEERLSGLNEGFEDVTAPPQVKEALDARLFSSESKETSFNLHALLIRFRIPILLALAAIAILFPIIDQNILNAPQLIYTADIQAIEDYDATFSAEITDQGLLVTQTAGIKPADKDYELWLVRADGQVLTLGILTKPLNPDALDIPADAKLAISVEPLGGSPTGVATGPVIAIGPLTKA